MRLSTFRVTMFKSVIDSGSIAVEPLGVLVASLAELGRGTYDERIAAGCARWIAAMKA